MLPLINLTRVRLFSNQKSNRKKKDFIFVFVKLYQPMLESRPEIYPPASEASRGVYWNQTQKIFTHRYTWVSVTLALCHSVTLRPKNLSKLAPSAGGPWDLSHKFHLYLIFIFVFWCITFSKPWGCKTGWSPLPLCQNK